MEHVAFGRHLLLEAANDEKKTKGGILLPTENEGAVQASSKRSRVVSVSEQLVREFEERGLKFPLEIGTVVYHAFHIGTPVHTHDDRKLISIHIDNIWSIEVGDD